MGRRLAALWLPSWFLLYFACGTGEVVEQPPPVENPPVVLPPMLPPPVQPNERVTVSGRVVAIDEYLGGQTVGIEGANITALGVTNVLPATSAADGSYSIGVPQNGQIIFAIAKEQYLASYEAVSIGDRNLEGKTTYLAPERYVDGIATTYGVPQGSYGVIIGRVVDDGTEQNGVPAPIAGVTSEGFTVEGATVRGPYFLTATGAANSGLTATVRELGPGDRYRGGLFVMFVELPIGTDSIDLSVEISRTGGDGTTYYYGPTEVKVFRDAFVWSLVAETARNQPPPPPVLTEIDFDSQIYPLFLPVPEGGLGCQGCHTSYNGATPAAGLDLYGGAERAFASLDPIAYPARVNLANPTASYLLTKPLYEPQGNQDHPIIAFLSDADPGYRLILSWIAEGALRNNVELTPVSFYRDIRPMLYQPYDQGGIGCFACHVDGANNANNAPGKLYMGGDGVELFYALTEEAPEDNGATGEQYRVNRFGYPARSLLLINPLAGNPEPHPVKLFYGVDDPRYQLIYRWISEGYLDDSPQ
jgi:hypothetical protein